MCFIAVVLQATPQSLQALFTKEGHIGLFYLFMAMFNVAEGLRDKFLLSPAFKLKKKLSLSIYTEIYSCVVMTLQSADTGTAFYKW